ncbi:metal ABC transporter permease [Brevibacillus sp. DP1.3A]|uniref:metal ABC transporter permease n=1 Tax=Brevibacillus sp. DP1.3A TaxID=2738867 RepID=UPI00156AEFEF|nr:metal ABC transporter permease [Brevibacillus sp. DP1.3A]MED1915169.1 metal ABC transporter permease [Bacillus thuringiensis]UED73687.1 metal ABC transporter permease [Brevibacillus sp. DP1.3A]
MDFLMAIGQYEFLQKALFTSVVVGLICGVIGSFIILRGMSLMGDAISHAVLPGVALSYAFGINFFVGAVLTGVLTAVGIGYVSQNSRIKNDTAIGILFTSAFAIGIIMVTMLKSSTDLYHILFGNVLAVRSSDMWVTVGIGVIVIVTVYAFFKELLLTSFDPTIAAAYGLRNNLIHYLLMTLLTMVTVASLQTVGIVLVVAMLITPAATAYLLTDRLSIMIFLAGGFGMLSAVIGLYFSFTYNLASGATIVVVATVLFFLAFLFSPKHGVVWKSIRARQKRVELSK